MIEPGGTIGILGGGQLGRMTALAAATLGYRCHIFCPEPDSPAKRVTPFATTAEYDDRAALRKFAAAVDVVTFEFENVPAETVDILAALKPVRPGPDALRIAQDRLKEKDFLRAIDVATARYQEVASEEALSRALRDVGLHGVLKTVRLGYDGKGQVMIRPDTDLTAAWRQMGAELGILESFVDFACEISVIVARGMNGASATYVPVENQHSHHILDTTIAPARIAPEIAMRAEARPHNSGHWTIDACVTSQFEQFVRAICGLPLGSPERHSDAVMKNLIGDDVARWREALNEPTAKLHLYDKGQPRPGRKMGHVTRLLPRR